MGPIEGSLELQMFYFLVGDARFDFQIPYVICFEMVEPKFVWMQMFMVLFTCLIILCDFV
jgi:hypothetical protein